MDRQHLFGGALAAALMGSLAFGLGGCAGMVVGAGASVGVAAMEERGLEQAARDLRIKTEIREAWFRKDHRMIVNLGVEVNEGRVLLTGITPDANEQADGVDMAWKVDGVKEVYNEIIVAPDTGFGTTMHDTWITSQLKTKVTFDKTIHAINYDIHTMAGTIYLIGIAQSQAELDRVLGHARNITYVERVVSYVRLKTAT